MQNSKSIYEEFFVKDKKIIIPDYQREYSWTKDDIKIFLEDIKKSIEDNNGENMYLGTIYTYEPENLNEVHIIDGQQRLTTTLLFLYVISNNIIKDNSYMDFLYLDSGYEKRIKSDNKQLEMAYSYSLYEEDVEKDEANDQIEENMKLINSLLEEDIDLANKVNKFIRTSLNVSIVTVKKLNESLKIFMNLNARGKELQAMEIIKSMLFSYILDMDLPDKNLKLDLKDKFSDIINEGDTNKYNKNMSNFKKILFLFISNLDINEVEKKKLKASEKDKLFASKFMNILKEKYDLNSYKDMKKFIGDFKKFTITYIWWNNRLISTYHKTDIEKEFRDKYTEIKKGKCNEYATLVSYNHFNFNNLREDFYKEILYAFSVLEFNKLFNNYFSDGIANHKIDLSFIERDNKEIINLIKENNIEGFKELFNKKDYLITEKNYKEFVNKINELKKIEDIKELDLIKIVIKNIQDGNRIIKC